jgi:hypothetical protein
MRAWADVERERLRERFPDWDVWWVQAYPKGQTWHAKPKGAPVATIHAESPEELAKEIAKQESA